MDASTTRSWGSATDFETRSIALATVPSFAIKFKQGFQAAVAM